VFFPKCEDIKRSLAPLTGENINHDHPRVGSAIIRFPRGHPRLSGFSSEWLAAMERSPRQPDDRVYGWLYDAANGA
jgi:hypothetical protein